MFNLLVARDSSAWESSNCRILLRRFGEYSGQEAEKLTFDAASLRLLEQLPTLLAYESATESPNAHIVRYGTISNLHQGERDFVFHFVPDPEHGYLPRDLLKDFADELDLHRFELSRTHWAVKDGDIPSALLQNALPRPPARNVPLVYAAYREAVKSGNSTHSVALNQELADFPPSEEKAIEFLRGQIESTVCMAAYAVLDIGRHSIEARSSIDALHQGKRIVVDPYPAIGFGSESFLTAAFYAAFGGPTEVFRLRDAIEDCVAIVSELESTYRLEQTGVRSIAYVLWQSARYPLLAEQLRRRLNGLVDRMMQDRTSVGTWDSEAGDSDRLATAMITVGIQRIGDDKHRDALRSTVQSLCQKLLPSGGLPALTGQTDGDVLTTMLMLEAIQRSGFADELEHIIERAETWLMKQQRPTGEWRVDGWPDVSVTALVLDYFEHRASMLPQVDGFFLMARDFVKKAIDLKIEGGANNRRLAAVAAAHAVEMFLYGLFGAKPDLGVCAYRDNGAETIGPRAALSELQKALQRNSSIAKGRSLSCRDQLNALIRERDNIIHHASEITQEELHRGLSAVQKFITAYGTDLVGLDILQ